MYRRFVGKLLLERRFDQRLEIALLADNAAHVPAGVYGDQSRHRSDPQGRHRTGNVPDVEEKTRRHNRFDPRGHLFGFHIHQMSGDRFGDKRECLAMFYNVCWPSGAIAGKNLKRI